MRKRKIKKNFYLSEEEQHLLREKAKQVGLNEAEFLRCLIRGFIPNEKPGKEFYDEIKNLRQIGNNLNQLTKYTNTTGNVREIEIIKTKDLIEQIIYNLQEKFLSKQEIKLVINTK